MWNNMEIYLISEKTLKTESYINDNVDSSMILPSIITSQDIHLQQLIGTNLYKKLKSLVSEDKVDGKYKELLDDYIRPFLIHAVMSDIQIPLAFKQRNNGITQGNSEHMNNTFMNEVKELKTYYEQKMNFYGLRMSDWLKANVEYIPEYSIRTDCSEIPSDSGNYNTSILLD